MYTDVVLKGAGRSRIYITVTEAQKQRPVAHEATSMVRSCGLFVTSHLSQPGSLDQSLSLLEHFSRGSKPPYRLHANDASKADPSR